MTSQPDKATRPLSLKANMLWNSIGSMIYLGCQWLITILVVRLSNGYEAAGLIGLAGAVVGMFIVIGHYKMDPFQVSDVRHDHSLGQYMGFRLLTLVIAAVICMTYAVITCPPQAILTVALYFIYLALMCVSDICRNVNQLNHRLDYSGRSLTMDGVLSLIAFALVFWATGDVNLAIGSMAVALLAVLLFYDLPHARLFDHPNPRLTRRQALTLLRLSAPAVVAAVVGNAVIGIPRQYLSLTHGESALGIYTSVGAIALVIQMGATYIYKPLLGVFAESYWSGDARGALKLLVKAISGILAVALLCSLALWLLGEWVLGILFPSSIQQYTYLLQPILLTTTLTGLLWFFTDLLIAWRDMGGVLVGNLVAFTSVLPLSYWLINRWDMNGLSFASAGACAIGILFLAVHAVFHWRKRGQEETVSQR